jgi:NurA-like 5'-3' nuclease
VGYTSAPVTKFLIQNTEFEHEVVDDQKEYRPFDKREIQSAYAFFDEGGFVVQIFQRKEITGCNKEYRHVKFIQECL